MTSSSATSTSPIPHYADNLSAFPMEGGCCCGHIRYRLEQAPMAVHCCHCTSCGRETGSAFGINLIIESASVTLLPPAPPTTPSHPGAPDTFPKAGPAAPAGDDRPQQQLLRVSIPQESHEPQHVSHCPRCLTAVWTEYGGCGPVVSFVRAGTLDRPWLVQPDLHLYVRSKREFVTIPDDVPQFEEYYDRTQVWRPESMERWDRLVPEFKKFQVSQKAE